MTSRVTSYESVAMTTTTYDARAGRGSDELFEQAGVDVVQEAADLGGLGDQGVGAHLGDVVAQGGALVLDHIERLPGRVQAGRLADPLAELGQGGRGHRAAGVRDDQDALDAQQVYAEDEGLEGLGGDPAAGVAEDLGVAEPEAEH